MEVRETTLPGVLVLEPKRHGDTRGFFCEFWNRNRMRDAGLDVDFVQDNMSLSADAGTLRGMHYQSPPHAQTKLVGCVHGSLHDVVVDARRGSPTYGQHFAIDLSFENGLQLFVPAGFLHGFVTREPNTVISYKVDDYYSQACDGAVRWDSCGIDWDIGDAPLLSDKDTVAPRFEDFDSPFRWETA
ncbi:MAG: dTDP-4-dehydrorhamnose 3,5-epimerase [Silicimonas sp.]